MVFHGLAIAVPALASIALIVALAFSHRKLSSLKPDATKSQKTLWDNLCFLFIVLSIICSIVTVFSVAANIYSLLQAYFAPRLYVIEYISEMVH